MKLLLLVITCLLLSQIDAKGEKFSFKYRECTKLRVKEPTTADYNDCIEQFNNDQLSRGTTNELINEVRDDVTTVLQSNMKPVNVRWRPGGEKICWEREAEIKTSCLKGAAGTIDTEAVCYTYTELCEGDMAPQAFHLTNTCLQGESGGSPDSLIVVFQALDCSASSVLTPLLSMLMTALLAHLFAK